ncbi:ferredoxin--NADP reductase [Patiriisocius marinus]|uniref:ferredoxin--NADP reductase n=1 Tax=Patiriisocius marinus TaxID=1397112 RepID=UPI00232AA715|nr:ferredoxin--NADP reductase [Patiriisocius marinus]
MSNFHPLKISEVKKETPNAVVVTFDVPMSLQGEFNFIAGQYITIKHTHEGKEIRRAYSLCSTPKSGKLSIGIKKVEGGSFSVFANEYLTAGDTLEVMPPQGKFVLKPNENTARNYMAFAAGSGITPILSIAATALEQEPDSKFLLIYGNQSKENTMFYDDLMKLKQDHPQRFFPEFVFSRTKEDQGASGRIDHDLVNDYLKNKFQFTIFDTFFLCGPEPMIDVVSSTLKENGINEKAVHFELFTTSEGDLLVEPHDGMTTISITIDDETETFEMKQSDSILDAALAKDLDAPYSCQGGICSTCIARITEGKAEMRKNQILTDGEIAEGLILTCQAHPTTAKVVVDYDDV